MNRVSGGLPTPSKSVPPIKSLKSYFSRESITQWLLFFLNLLECLPGYFDFAFMLDEFGAWGLFLVLTQKTIRLIQ